MKTIPKIIHYFWFGNKPLSPQIKECIASWGKYCPNYKIKKWSEKNFDIRKCPLYVKEAYSCKKWAFVSDYARLYVLNKYGGIYFDTDVKLLKSIDKIIKKGPFLACENGNYDSINPGVGMASYSNNKLITELLNQYQKEHFILDNGQYNQKTIVLRTSKILKAHGLKNIEGIQKVDGFNIYPRDYFCPLDYDTGRLKITNNTIAIHLYLGSWLSNKEKKLNDLEHLFVKLFGEKIGIFSFKCVIKPYNIKTKIQTYGLKETSKYYINKFKGNFSKLI